MASPADLVKQVRALNSDESAIVLEGVTARLSNDDNFLNALEEALTWLDKNPIEKWLRMRFHANPDDYRPIHWPPIGPYWCTGYAGDDSYSMVVAYVRNKEQVTEFWPEASAIELLSECDEITYSDRFPQPEWYKE